MRRYSKRFAALLLAAAMLLGLAGCGKDEEKKVADLGFKTSLYYTVENVSETARMLIGCCTDRESIWYLSQAAEDAALALTRVKLDGTAEVLPAYQSPVKDGAPAYSVWGPVLGGDGKLWVWERFADPADSRNSTYRVRQLEPDSGKELAVMDITEAMGGMDRNSTSGFLVDASGTVWLADKLHIIAVDGQGQVLSTLKTRLPETLRPDAAGGLLALLPDGTIGALVVQEGDGRKVRVIDPETRDWAGAEYYVQNNVKQIYSGNDNFDFYYISQDTVYAATGVDEVPARLLPWSNVNLDRPNTVRCFVLREDGEAFIFSDLYDSSLGDWGGKLQAARLLPLDAAPEGAPVKVVYGTIGVDWCIQNRVEAFNLANKGYRVEIRDYSEGMMTWGEKNSQVYQSALSRLYADLSTGQGPDIIDGSIPLEGLARQDGLEDLMDHVLECMETDGKLTSVCSSFAIETAVASAEAAGNRTGWTMEEMLDAFGGQMPEFYFERIDEINLLYPMFQRFDRASALRYLVNMDLNRYIDWETGECSFDSEDFKALLRLAGSGEAAAESTLDLNDWRVRYDLGLKDSDLRTGNVELCQVFPWEGKPLLLARTLSTARDLVVDDVLFGGREPLTDYEQRLWDAEILYVQGVTKYSYGHELIRTRYFTMENEWRSNGFMQIQLLRYDIGKSGLAADCAVGGADGELYAAYPGFPAADGGSGSSFTLQERMGISAASTRKEEAWAFVRSLLLPWDGDAALIPDSGMLGGYYINRASFERQMQMGPEYWTDPYTGALFPDADGKPVEFSKDGVGVGYPGDIVLMAYLFRPSEAQMERFWRLYEATDHISGREDELVDLILEAADAYFAGDKSLDETASLIQNRAKIYVNERR